VNLVNNLCYAIEAIEIYMHLSGNKWINHVEMLEKIRRRHIGGVDGLGNGCKRGSGHVCRPCSERKRKYCINMQQKVGAVIGSNGITHEHHGHSNTAALPEALRPTPRHLSAVLSQLTVHLNACCSQWPITTL
jgi:hypothetical protein